MIKAEFDLFGDTVECDWNRRSTFGELTGLTFCQYGDLGRRIRSVAYEREERIGISDQSKANRGR